VLTLIFDEDFDSRFRWKLTVENDDILKLLVDEKMPADEMSQEIGKHKWAFEGNETGTAVLKFEYVNPLTGYTPERYMYTVKNTNGSLEILLFESFSGNRTIHNRYTERIEVSENKTLLTLVGLCHLAGPIGLTENEHWILEQNQSDVLNIIDKIAEHYTTVGEGWHTWKMEGQNSGNVALTMSYVKSEGKVGLVSEIVCEIHISENKEISILNINYNSVRGEPLPYW
jgi:predicted secreted protein